MELLQRINTPSNPRFGVNHGIVCFLEHLRAFFGADACFLVLQDLEEAYSLRQVKRSDQTVDESARVLAPDVANLLMSFAPRCAVFYRSPRPHWGWESLEGIDVKTGKKCPLNAFPADKVAALVGCHFLSLPLVCHKNTVGRIYITSRTRRFGRREVDFIFPIITRLTAMIKNMELVDRLASDAAEEERLRIARDIHDSIIQPYIGLQMAISVIRQKVQSGDKNLLRDVNCLEQMCHEGTQELRAYVGELKTGRANAGNLLPAVQRFAAKFSTATSIEVEVEVEANQGFSVHDRLAAQVLQMVIEGLSNIHRHTRAQHAWIRLKREQHRLELRIENSGDVLNGESSFSPRSITERAHSLGGDVSVRARPDGGAIITVDIPL